MTEPHLQNLAPVEPTLTDYDRAHTGMYLRLLDAEEAGADWREVVKIVFGLDPAVEFERCRLMHASHLQRAHWIAHQGYGGLVWPTA